ncbi:ankyrin repeat domain-containing protein [Helicobacter pametensis]|uniref:ankyrin repeat domain-containing protein n=1 Tax=Helicobacter pametensis TaxID=95149 RepID=UPI0004B0D203|nr:ankyrin repeat domain-containing protein [Helicobacter pametensis]
MKKLVFLCCLTLTFLMASSRWDAYLFSDDYTTVRQGITRGGDLNSRWRGMTPLYNACRSGWADIVELMINRGADVNAKSYGETVLLKAAGKKVNDVTLAKVLLSNGADVNAQDTQGNTALYHAIMNKNGKMIKLLLDNGADMYIKNKRGDSPARFILSKKSMPSVSFDNPDLMLSAQSFLLGRSTVPVGVVNKTAQFMKISQIAVYFNGDLLGSIQVNINVAPRAKMPNIGSIKLPATFYQNLKIKENGRAVVKYGLAVEYSLDGSSKSFENSKDIELALW